MEAAAAALQFIECPCSSTCGVRRLTQMMTRRCVRPGRRSAQSIVRASVAVVGIGATLASCEPSHTSLRPIDSLSLSAIRPAAGCWRFDRGTDRLQERISPGSMIHLDTVPAPQFAQGGGRFELLRVGVVPADSNAARRTRVSGWGLDSADAGLLHIHIGDGFTGLAFRMRLQADTLRGSARAYTDVSPDFSFRHAARAVRVPCS